MVNPFAVHFGYNPEKNVSQSHPWLPDEADWIAKYAVCFFDWVYILASVCKTFGTCSQACPYFAEEGYGQQMFIRVSEKFRVQVCYLSFLFVISNFIT